MVHIKKIFTKKKGNDYVQNAFNIDGLAPESFAVVH